MSMSNDHEEAPPMDVHELVVGDELDLADGVWYLEEVSPNHDRTEYHIRIVKSTVALDDEDQPSRPSMVSASDVAADLCLSGNPECRHDSSRLIKSRVPEDWE